MSAKQKISRLEQLLARVQSRAGAPRTAAPVAHAVPSPPVPAAVLAPPPQPQRASSPAPPIVQRRFTPPPETSVDQEMDEVEVSAGGVVEVDIDVEEGMPMESGAHAVAPGTLPPDEIDEDATLTSRPPPVAEAPEAEPAEAFAAPANEIVEPEPSSSPRPIAEEAESAPRHTPPPESGKQVAAPSVHPPSRKSTAPPPSDGHTLIGGWREPGLGQPAQPVITTGVRVPAPQQVSPPAPPPQPSGTRLSPDVTKADLPAHVQVAAFEGAVAAPRPLTFGELVDATLGL